MRGALLLAVACAACSSSATNPAGSSYPLWSTDPLSNANPFPDSRLIGFDGGLGARPQFWQGFVPPALVAEGSTTFQTFMGQLSASLQPLTGFGNYGGILVPFSVAVDPGSLSAGTYYVSLGGAATSSPSPGPDSSVTYQSAYNFAEIHPSLPLQPGENYLLVLTDTIADASEQPLGRSPDFQTFASSGQGQAMVATAAQVLNTTAAHIIFVMEFQTESTRDLETLSSGLQSPPASPYVTDIPATPVPVSGCGTPMLGSQCPSGVFTRDAGTLDDLLPWFTVSPFDGGGNGYQDPPADVGIVVAGGVTLQDVRDSENGTFQAAAVADPNGAGRAVERQFVLVTPDPALMPDGGWPMVLVGHGLGQANTLQLDSDGKPVFSECVMLAEFFTKAGFGCIGIDAPSHGSRGSSALFFDFAELEVTRDYFREMTFDQMQLQRFAASWPAGQQGITIDPQKLTYFGVSLGGIMGANFLSLDKRTTHGVLNVPGGGLYQIFQSPSIFAELGFLLAQVNLGVSFLAPDGGVNPDFLASLPFLEASAQAILEPGDSINNATLFSGKHVLMQEGLGDQTVPNETTDQLAATMRVPTLLAASSAPTGASGLWKYDLTQYGVNPDPADGGVDPHDTFFVVPQARDQVANYLTSFGTSISAE